MPWYPARHRYTARLAVHIVSGATWQRFSAANAPNGRLQATYLPTASHGIPTCPADGLGAGLAGTGGPFARVEGTGGVAAAERCRATPKSKGVNGALSVLRVCARKRVRARACVRWPYAAEDRPRSDWRCVCARRCDVHVHADCCGRPHIARRIARRLEAQRRLRERQRVRVRPRVVRDTGSAQESAVARRTRGSKRLSALSFVRKGPQGKGGGGGGG